MTVKLFHWPPSKYVQCLQQKFMYQWHLGWYHCPQYHPLSESLFSHIPPHTLPPSPPLKNQIAPNIPRQGTICSSPSDSGRPMYFTGGVCTYVITHTPQIQSKPNNNDNGKNIYLPQRRRQAEGVLRYFFVFRIILCHVAWGDREKRK